MWSCGVSKDHAEQGDVKQALEYYRYAVQLKPDFIDGWDLFFNSRGNISPRQRRS